MTIAIEPVPEPGVVLGLPGLGAIGIGTKLRRTR
ncbi:MAG TPA: PEP-CTERM sorting domain-containing protein [Elainellaceae cyanobacterium]